jgi:hypothetical protein
MLRFQLFRYPYELIEPFPGVIHLWKPAQDVPILVHEPDGVKVGAYVYPGNQRCLLSPLTPFILLVIIIIKYGNVSFRCIYFLADVNIP